MMAMVQTPNVTPLRAVPDPVDVPPHDDIAERSTLSAVMLDASAMPKVADFLRAEHFFRRPNATLFEACAGLTADRDPIDLTTVHSWLSSRGRLAEAGGAGYISEVADGSPNVVNVRSHALAVHDCWRRRMVIAACQRAAATGYQSVGDVQKFCDDTVRTIAKLGNQNPGAPIETMSDALNRILADAMGEASPDPLKKPQALGVPTGIPSLDRLIGGLRRKAKTTIAAEKGGGKTALALQMAIHAAMAGIAVIMFSTELTQSELMSRAICLVGGVDRNLVKEKRLSQSDIDRLIAATARLKALPMHIDPTARLTPEQLRAKAETYAEKSMLVNRTPLGLVVVDYVQRLAPSAFMAQREERQQIAHATRELKILSQEMDVAVLELAQANPPQQKGKQRVTRTMWGSSVIGKESDEEIFIVPDPDCDPRSRVRAMTLDITKQRDGKLGEVFVRFVGPQFRFEDPNAERGAPSRQYVDTNPLTEGL